MIRNRHAFPIAAALAVAVALHAPARPQASVAAAAVTPDATVERVAKLVETLYVVPALGARYAAMLRGNVAAGRYAGLADAGALGERITADLQAVAPDGHLRVRPPRGPRPAATATATPAAQVAPGIAEARWIAPGVAYVSFTRFSDDPAAAAALTGFLRCHRHAAALIVDARDHHGGTFPLLGIFGNRLYARPQRLAVLDVARKVFDATGNPFPEGPELRRVAAPQGLVRFEHWSVPATDGASLAGVPVYYLTSRLTYSAGEHMAMMLKSSRRATLVGETTGGGNHFGGGTEDVGSGLELFVPIGRTNDPATGEDWELRGVAPDVAVPADRALDTALRLIAAKRRRG